MAKYNSTRAFNNTERISMQVRNSILPIRDIIEGYVNNSEREEGGVSSMNGKLNIRPRYQRAYIADITPNWRENLINSIICGFPINRIYIGVASDAEFWEENAKLEMIDGQQRTITICDYIKGDFAITIDNEPYHFKNLDPDTQELILSYNLDVTYCKGPESARIAWFKRINQPNSILTPQELRNSTYLGTWLESAKRFFCASTSHANKQITDKSDKYCIHNYTTDRHIERAECLETAIDWLAIYTYADLRGKKDMDTRICKYMSEHQDDENADELIAHYKRVIDWGHDVFGECVTRKSAKKVEWGRLYALYHNNEYDIDALRSEAIELFADTDVTAYSAVFEYVLMDKEVRKPSMLVLRAFTQLDKSKMYEMQNGVCPIDGKQYKLEDMQAHHIVSWTNGGKTVIANGVLLSKANHEKLHANADQRPEELRERRNEMFPAYLEYGTPR